MKSKDFSVKGRNFKVRKLDPFKQLHIARRLAPILQEMIPGMKESGVLKEGGLKDVEKLSMEEQLDLAAKFITPILSGASKLSDEDTDKIMFGLLETVEMQQQPTGNWCNVVSGNLLMVEDLELPELLNLAGRSFWFNLSRFFNVLPQ